VILVLGVGCRQKKRGVKKVLRFRPGRAKREERTISLSLLLYGGKGAERFMPAAGGKGKRRRKGAIFLEKKRKVVHYGMTAWFAAKEGEEGGEGKPVVQHSVGRKRRGKLAQKAPVAGDRGKKRGKGDTPLLSFLREKRERWRVQDCLRPPSTARSGRGEKEEWREGALLHITSKGGKGKRSEVHSPGGRKP